MSDLMTPRYWRGSIPVRCDLTDIVRGKHDISGEFVDGRTTRGPWAIMCLKCSRVYGVGAGTGSGQHYKRQENGRWLKIDG